MTGRSARPPADRGAVTVEAAVGLATLVVTLVICLAGIAAAVAQIRCVAAATAAARLDARGDRVAAQAAVAALAPAGASVSYASDGDLVTVTVSAAPVGILSGIRVSGRAVAAQEEQGVERE